jgi:hypothetical protein
LSFSFRWCLFEFLISEFLTDANTKIIIFKVHLSNYWTPDACNCGTKLSLLAK